MRTLMVPVLLAGALAASASAQLTDPVSSCKITADTLDFASYSVISRIPKLTTGLIELRCSEPVVTTSVRVSVSAGSSGSYQERTLLNGTHRLIYNLYADASRQLIAGDGTQGTSTLIGNPALANRKNFQRGLVGASRAVFRVYGRIEPSQAVPAGEYADTIQVIVEF